MNKKQQEYYNTLVDIATTKGGFVVSQIYLGCSVKMTFRCSQGHEWLSSPSNIKSGTWCNVCCRLPSKDTEAKFLSIVREKGGECLTAYTGNKNHVLLICSQGHEWSTAPGRIITGGTWCRECSINDRKGKPRTTKRQAEQKFRQIVASKDGEVIGEYLDSQTPVLVKCLQGHEWPVRPTSIDRGTWCNLCNRRVDGIREDLNRIVREKGGRYEGEYNKDRDHLVFYCSKGHSWITKPGHIRDGRWCNLCSNQVKVGNYIDKLTSVVNERGGQIEGEYIDSQTHLAFVCKKNHRWKAIPNNITQGKWCPRCCESKRERAVATILDELQILYEREWKHPSLPRRRYDFYFIYKDKHVVLEFDGIQHFEYSEFFHSSVEEFNYRREVDKIKTYVALETGCKFIRIDYLQDNIRGHLKNALLFAEDYYVSDVEKYSYLCGNIDIDVWNLEL